MTLFSSAAALGSPFTLRIEETSRQDDRVNLEVRIQNQSKEIQMFLVNSYIQPLVPHAVAGGDKPFAFFDRRAKMKFDINPYKQLFKSLAPNDQIVVGSIVVSLDEGLRSIQLGTFHASQIENSCFDIDVSWHSKIDEAVHGKERKKVPNLWIGKLRSNKIQVCLPETP